MKLKNFFLFLILPLITFTSHAQFIPVTTDQKDIYLFLNELNSEGFIRADLSVTPLSRNIILKHLIEAKNNSASLSSNHKKELSYFTSIYNDSDSLSIEHWGQLFNKKTRNKKQKSDFFHYHDSTFTFVLNPIIGYTYSTSNSTINTHRKNGAMAYGTMGKWSLWVNLRDNNQKILTNKIGYLNQETGGSIKQNILGGGDYEEINGGAAYSNKWVTIALMKEHITWGENLNGSNILSNKAPSVPMIFLQINPVKWLSVNFTHAWLVSNIIDSNQSYNYSTGYRTVMYHKFLASNYINIRPFKKLNFSIGNSIVYSNMGIQPAYLIPVMFYKAVDHSLNGMSNNTGQNSQMFGSLSTTIIPHTTFHISCFLDEISITRMRDKNSHSNFYSFKTGIQIHNFPIKNLSLFAEYTRTNPVTYNHFVPTTTYASNKYTLGHYLIDNSEEIWISATYRFNRIRFTVSYSEAKHGNDYPYTGTEKSVLGLPYMDTVFWDNKTLKFEAFTNITEHINLNCSYSISNIVDVKQTYTPSYLIGRKETVSIGFGYGF